MKDISSLVNTILMKIVVISNKNLVFVVVKEKDRDKSNDSFNPYYPNEVLDMEQKYQWGGKQQIYFNVLEKNISPTIASSTRDL